MKTKTSPPRFPLSFFRWFCHPDLLPSIEGDLMELFNERTANSDQRSAKWLFVWDVIKLFRPSIIRPVEGSYRLNRFGMLKNYFKVACRNIIRNKAFSVINISGLVIGMAAALIIAKYVGFVLKYDQFHEKKEQIFMIHQEEKKNGVAIDNGKNTYWQSGSVAKELYPEVLKSSHYGYNVETLVTVNNEDGEILKFNEENIKSVDPDFLEIFSFDFISGDPATALSQPNSVVITKSIAAKYFKDESALGKFLNTRVSWGEEHILQITGVIEDVPVFSRFQFDFLKSSVGFQPEDYWEYPTSITYLLLDENTDPELLTSKLAFDINNQEELKSDQRSVDIELVSISKALISDTEIMLALVGLFTLLITWINFINLTSAKSLSRSKETGIRKVLGSGKSEIVKQFVFEGMVINCTALVLSVGLVWMLYPFISVFADQRILPLFADSTPINWIFLGLFLFGALLSSAYPAAILSGLQPVSSIKGQVMGQLTGESFRKALVVVQFSISVILIIGVFVISDQMKYMRNKDLGINLNQTLILKSPKDSGVWDEKRVRLSTLRNKISHLSFVQNVTSSSQVPGMGYGQEVNFRIDGSKETVATNLISVYPDFMHFYGVKIIAGQDFSTERIWNNRRGILINKSTALGMGYASLEDAVNQKIVNPFTNQSYTILGVVDDFHQRSVKEKMQPMVFEFNQFRGHISIKIDSANYSNIGELQQSIAMIENVWNEVYSDQAFDYFFLDERFNTQYQSDIRFRELFGVFTGISVFIACLGLFGLSLFMAQKKQKEVGIRKVFGASIVQVIFFFIKKHLGQMLVSVVIGIPIAYLLMDSWLDHYSNRISINSWELIIPSLLVVAISILTIGFHSLKVSLINPAKTLRNE
ncbi:ABC transporter permease [Reichenbachiella sp. MALMAid0571]|uniref:ABC transporter permease n=1 Tax=Reichenbachiella sp. MALMAid0571 TaxID=3143939 RepID=UPI0032E009E9